MAGYSGTPLAKKLGIKPGCRLLPVNAPTELSAWLAPLPDDVKEVSSRSGSTRPIDVILFFTRESAELARRFDALTVRLAPAGGLWVCWPKKASKVPTDLDENRVREIGLAAGLVDNKVCAVSDVWSGLRFVIRLKDRPR